MSGHVRPTYLMRSNACRTSPGCECASHGEYCLQWQNRRGRWWGMAEEISQFLKVLGFSTSTGGSLGNQFRAASSLLERLLRTCSAIDRPNTAAEEVATDLPCSHPSGDLGKLITRGLLKHCHIRGDSDLLPVFRTFD